MALCLKCRGRCRVQKNPDEPSAGLGICPICAGKGHDQEGTPTCLICDGEITLTGEGWECKIHGFTWAMKLIKATGVQSEQGAVHCIVIVDVKKQSVSDIITFACSNKASIAADLSQGSEEGPFFIVQFPGGEQQSLNRQALEIAIEKHAGTN